MVQGMKAWAAAGLVAWMTLAVASCGDGAPEGDTQEGARGESVALEVRVDPRVELVAILFHMAGRDEYNMTQVAAWEAAVDSHFDPYSAHPAVTMTERLAGPYNVGFFVPMNLAVHLTPPSELAVRSPLAESPSIHRTWTTYPDTTTRYLELVRSFARATRFDDFMRAQRGLVDSTEARLRRLVEETVELDWFDEFWGVEPGARFTLVPGLINGRASYGVEYEDTATRELFAITGVVETDEAGLPVFGPDFTATVVHELNHPYADPVVGANLDALQPAADTLFARNGDVLRRQAIGSGETLLYESLVRAAVARYRGSVEGPEAMQEEVAEQVELGFAWMPALVELLGDYEADRDRYPTIQAFIPRIAEHLREAAGGAGSV